MLVLRSIKELEFDRAMGKVSDQDFQEMAARLRARAIALMKQLDDSGAGYRQLIEQELRTRLGRAGTPPAAAAAPRRRPRRRPARPRARPRSRTRRSPRRLPRLRREGRRGRALLQAVRPASGRFLRGDRTASCQHEHSSSGSSPRPPRRTAALARRRRPRARQVMGQPGGMAMPDPSQMSGVPLPSADLPVGTVSVLVVRGAMTNTVGDQPVQLHGGRHGARPEDGRHGPRGSSPA